MDKALFVKIEEHKELQSVLDEVYTKLDIAKNKIEKLRTLKKQESEFIENWSKDTQEIEQKIDAIKEILDQAQ